jgi:SH3-like domain-containing protein
VTRFELFAFCIFLAACRTKDAPRDAAPPKDAGLSFTFADADPLTSAPSADVPRPEPIVPESRLAAYAHAAPRALESIGHTSVVFRVDFAGGLRAAYKPESKRGHKRYRGEIAAFRLAKLLGLPNVPAAGLRVFSRAALRAAANAHPRAASLFDAEVVDRGGRVYGSLVPWIHHLQFTPVEAPTERTQWERELRHGEEIPADRRSLDAQISTLVVFDALTGNWDRWSGANVGIDRATGTLLFVDNDAAFFDPVPPAFKPQMKLVRGVERFSRSLVARLRALDAIALADAFGDEEPGTPLLAARVVAACDQRRRDVLALVDAKIAALGEAAVLYFP